MFRSVFLLFHLGFKGQRSEESFLRLILKYSDLQVRLSDRGIRLFILKPSSLDEGTFFFHVELFTPTLGIFRCFSIKRLSISIFFWLNHFNHFRLDLVLNQPGNLCSSASQVGWTCSWRGQATTRCRKPKTFAKGSQKGCVFGRVGKYFFEWCFPLLFFSNPLWERRSQLTIYYYWKDFQSPASYIKSSKKALRTRKPLVAGPLFWKPPGVPSEWCSPRFLAFHRADFGGAKRMRGEGWKNGRVSSFWNFISMVSTV